MNNKFTNAKRRMQACDRAHHLPDEFWSCHTLASQATGAFPLTDVATYENDGTPTRLWLGVVYKSWEVLKCNLITAYNL